MIVRGRGAQGLDQTVCTQDQAGSSLLEAEALMA